MVALERVAWPDDVQATEAQLRDRLDTFGEGCFGAYDGKHLVGMASCQITHYPSENVLLPWTALTADGWISRTHRRDGDCLHFVSICVHPESRHRGIGRMLNEARLNLAKGKALAYALTDARLPDLSRYLGERHGATAEQYVERVLAEDVTEPIVRMYLGLGFEPLGVISESMRSDRESANYGLAMLKVLREQ